MAEEGKGVTMVVLGIVAIIAVIGLILLFKGGAKGATGAAALQECQVIVGDGTTSCGLPPGCIDTGTARIVQLPTNAVTNICSGI